MAKLVTDEQLAVAVKISMSFSETVRNVGRKAVGGNISHYTRRIRVAGIDTSHFTGQLWSRGLSLPKRRVAENILVERSVGGRTNSKYLVRALLEIGRAHECEKCQQGTTWLGNRLTLDVDHIDQNWLNDSAENLRFLCPNCHSQFSRNLIGNAVKAVYKRKSKTDSREG